MGPPIQHIWANFQIQQSLQNLSKTPQGHHPQYSLAISSLLRKTVHCWNHSQYCPVDSVEVAALFSKFVTGISAPGITAFPCGGPRLVTGLAFGLQGSVP